MPTDRIIRLITSVLLVGALNVAVSDSAWLDKKYGYFAREESLRSLLYDFASSVSIPAIISSKINASISGNFPIIRAEDFLTDLAKTYDLSWIYDGTTLYVYEATEIEQKTIDLAYPLVRKFQDYMAEVDIQGVPLNWKAIPTQNVLQVSGPPRFVALVTEVVARLGDQDIEPPVVSDDGYTVRVFHIEYGYVDKAGNNASGNKTPIISLAEMLGNIMNVAHISKVVGSGVGAETRKFRGTGLVGKNTDEQTAAPIPESQVAGIRENEAYIIGDPRLNAIIVRDREDRIPTYERLIQELDKPLDQIEIEVSIFDIDATEAQNLGFDWEIRNTGPGFVYNTTLSPSEISGFIVRVSALQSKGKGRILSRPSVLTLDNHEALFQNNQTFYVRLGSPDDGSEGAAVDLVPVSYGSVIKVRPHVIYGSDERKIQMAIHVEDGRRSESTDLVSGLPEVAQNVIQTQAVIREGQSLLIGGYNVRERVLSERRIPLLGYVPILGFFFTNTSESDVSAARYFMITPRIIDTSINFEITTGFEDEDNEVINAVKEEAVGKPDIKRSYSGPP